ncbi:retrovirus-related pol polyprotein from transposon TNT 1-94 [Tanacetum coccineum]|uniref:Retrovirus-related pol polyprotein from transposon TNT 1-94 n=1 Tax=Tanacetum coccineum TaxID=301880 RepID=A0ABQ5DH34_9ASTR
MHYEQSLKNLCETSWILKMEKLENENASLEFHVQSLIKERENVKLEHQKLLDSIKKTRAQNQDLLITISELKAKLKNAEIGLGHNLFSVGQFCDGDLEVAFRSKTCYVRNLEGEDLLTGARDSNLYTIFISDMATSSPGCLISTTTSTKSWLWHRRLSHLNFGTINHLTKQYLVDGLPKFKYDKDHLCSTCEQGKSKKASLEPKLVHSTHSKLELIHMDLCGPMRDEAPEMIMKFIAQVQLSFKAQIQKIKSDNGTEFKNATLKSHYEKLGIMQQFSIARTPQQNGVVEQQNCTLVEVTRTMLIFSKALEFLWAEAISTACFTQNRSLVHTRYNKTPPIYDEYFEKRSPEVSTNSATLTTLNNEDTYLSSSIIVENNEAPPLVYSSEEQTSPILNDVADEFIQEDSTDLDGNTFITPFNPHVFEEA